MKTKFIYSTRHQSGFTMVEVVLFIVIMGIALAGTLSVLNLTNRHSADPIIQKEALSIAEGLMQEITTKYTADCEPDNPYTSLTALIQQNAYQNAKSTTYPPSGLPTQQGGADIVKKCRTDTTPNGGTRTFIGPDGGNIVEDATENRYSITSPFDEVKDYHGLHYDAYEDVTNKGIKQVGITSYKVDVAIQQYLQVGGSCQWTSAITNISTDGANKDCKWNGIRGSDVYKIKVAVKHNGEDALGIVLESYRTKFEPVIIDRKFTDQDTQKCFNFVQGTGGIYTNKPACI